MFEKIRELLDELRLVMLGRRNLLDILVSPLLFYLLVQGCIVKSKCKNPM